ncbi:putative feruloyl esterase [Aaosphaeria arxii CBS 175.79]|uniref:Carboxylic ester hydrolase n=1 Tax=Aaosphaeria arxii CBS 175.79 TaxID=1450172 RepID=A0A6A5Y1X2_9PLEO|nr:putative feruloyl esterase [Aaosphaeria arxii CBS 175.79]KAF2019236.1 putative feruloyl esterase [Aaosphaeria arxii CBS 175.79]
MTTNTTLCNASLLPLPTVPNATILSLTSNLVQNYTASSPPFTNPNHGPIAPVQVSFCNITIHHAHTSHPTESIETQIWLPTSWNGRIQAVGGGGYIAGLFDYMFIAMDAALAEGYAAYSTNAGIYSTDINGGDAHKWFLPPPSPPSSSGPNYHALEDFAYRSLGDMTTLGAQIVRSYYGRNAAYAYFSGCSNGGRQAIQLATRWPDAYDGIAACAPGLFWDEQVEYLWGHALMVESGAAPFPCELDALTKLAIEACDMLDGVQDGVLQDPGSCTFDPWNVLGHIVNCSDASGNHTTTISETAVRIADGVWNDNHRPSGLTYRQHSAGYESSLQFAGHTSCTNGTCFPDPNPLTLNWLRTFVIKDPKWSPANLTMRELEVLRKQSVDEFAGIIGNKYDLSAFAKRGGKMITYQGTADPAVPYKNSILFYTRASALSPPDVPIENYYRLFLAPGLGHGVGGKGAYPHETFHALVDWVENGKAPERLEASSMADEEGKVLERVLCAWPSRSVFKDGSWGCEGGEMEL